MEEGKTNTSTKGDTLTLEKFRETLDELFPVLYYGTDTNIEPGSLYYVKETDLSPEFIVCHPDDLEALKQKITARRLVHLKDEPPKQALDRLRKMWGKLSGRIYNDSMA